MGYQHVINAAIEKLHKSDPEQIARNCGADWKDGVILLPGLGKQILITYPQGKITTEGRVAGTAETIVVLHFLLGCQDIALSYDWMPFRQLPGGQGYAPAFYQRAERSLADRFGKDPVAFEAAVSRLGGVEAGAGCRLFFFFPRLPVLVKLGFGDNEIPAGAAMLFDSTAPSHLVTEDLAAVGELLAAKLIRAV